MDQKQCFRVTINKKLPGFEEMIESPTIRTFFFAPKTGEKFVHKYYNHANWYWGENGSIYIFPVLTQGEDNILEDLNVRFLPSTLLIDRYKKFTYEGKVIKKAYIPTHVWYMQLIDSRTILHPFYSNYAPTAGNPHKVYDAPLIINNGTLYVEHTGINLKVTDSEARRENKAKLNTFTKEVILEHALGGISFDELVEYSYKSFNRYASLIEDDRFFNSPEGKLIVLLDTEEFKEYYSNLSNMSWRHFITNLVVTKPKMYRQFLEAVKIENVPYLTGVC